MALKSFVIEPHGGKLVNLIATENDRESLVEGTQSLPSIILSDRQLCDLELLLCGAFSPLQGFMTREIYDSVLERLRLPDGTLWPMPIVLDLPADQAGTLAAGDDIVLVSRQLLSLAVMRVEDVWQPDQRREALAVFGTTDTDHPGVNDLLNRSGAFYVGGSLTGIALPEHYDFRHLRQTPDGMRRKFSQLGWNRIVGFQTRNPLHQAHVELTRRAMADCDAKLLIHPAVGSTKPGDVDHFTRTRCYQRVLPHYDDGTALLSLLPLAMRMAGPREALWHAIIRKNYGCSHFIVGRDHAGPGMDASGKPFYGPYDAQDLALSHADELGIEIVPFQALKFVPSLGGYRAADEIPDGVETIDLSGTELRRRLERGEEIPEWLTYPEIIKELRTTYPPRGETGFTVFFTGLSGAGKSTIGSALEIALMEYGKAMTVLDGDDVRTHLSSELGFSKEHRDLNIRRIAFVAREVTRHRGIAICAPIAPYEDARRYAREIIGTVGGFIEIHVSTPIEVCERRDPKGLYAKSRAGLMSGMTGIDDPYEVPAAPELRIDTSKMSVEDAVSSILDYLQQEGYIVPGDRETIR